MFIWDFVADTVLGQITDWVYGQIVGFLGSFFAQMGNMGADLFEMEWVQAIVMFFSCLAWALYVTGLVVAGFECGIEYQNGRGSIRETGVNALKGFFAASLFSTVPVELYRLCVSLQASLTRGLSGSGETFGEAAQRILSSLKDAGTWQEAAVSGVSLVDNIMILIINIFAALATGGAVVAGQYIGRKDEKSACKAATQLIKIDFAVLPETNCQGLFNQIHKKSTKKVPEALYGS